jgi:hypothetical protein
MKSILPGADRLQRTERELAAPSASECQGPADVGKLHHDSDRDVWYECVFDARAQMYTWTILPPAMPDSRCH